MKSVKMLALYSLLLLTLVGGCTDQAANKAAQAPVPDPAIAFEDCQLSSAGMSYSFRARCGTLAVYEDQVQKTGRKIDLYIAVIPAVSRTPATDALFLLAGGPGQAASETFPTLIPVFERVHQNRDIVMVDQRGTGKSNPLRCPDIEKTETGDEDISPEQQAELYKACLAEMDGDTRLYTTTATVEDLEEVRAALGYEKINLVGVSYGTRVALVYQRMYPQSLRTVILDSVTPVDWELGPENAVNGQRAMELIFERCSADPACRESFPNVQEEFHKLLADLEQHPAEVTLPHPTTGEMVTMKLTRQKAAAAFQILSYSPETVAYIPLLVHQTVSRGDYNLLTAQYLLVSGSLNQSIYAGLYLSVLCAEDVPFYPENSASAESYLSDPTGEMAKQCALWPHAQISPEEKKPVSSDIPTLLLSGEADPITPPSNAEKAAKNLSNDLNLVVAGIGHNVIYRGCIPRIVTDFIESGSIAGLDTACVQEIHPMPFMVNFSGSKP